MKCSAGNKAHHKGHHAANSTAELSSPNAFETLIQVDTSRFLPIEKIAVGDNILAAGKYLKWEKRTIKLANSSQDFPDDSLSMLIGYGDTQLAIAPDHFLLLSNGKLARACELSLTDTLSDADGNPIAIKLLQTGNYPHKRSNIATSLRLEDANLSGHLLILNGVVCGDYTLQLFYRER